MSTSGAIRARGTGVGGRPSGPSYCYVAGLPRRARERRRAILAVVASLAVLVPTGVLIHHITAGRSQDQVIAGEMAPGEQDAATGANQAQSAQPGSISPPLSRALARARAAGLKAGVDLRVTSGLRSAASQQALFERALVTYGSAESARRWVLPPGESNHVKGLAIDVGPRAAATWLEKEGVHFGLCRRYVNEWWHFERLAPAIGQKCPALEPYAGG